MSGRQSISEQLLSTPLPINRVARRVVKKAKAEDKWEPQAREVDHIVHSKNALPVRDMPGAIQKEMRGIIGKRRDRLVIVGYAAEQSGGASAKWVVRCDCGNYEHRTRILRWLGTPAEDYCRECRKRLYLKGQQHYSSEPAKREPKVQFVGAKA